MRESSRREEIRLMIYEYCIAGGVVIYDDKKPTTGGWRMHQGRTPILHRVCRQLYHEAIPYLYRRTRFYFLCPHLIPFFCSNVPALHLQNIRLVEMRNDVWLSPLNMTLGRAIQMLIAQMPNITHLRMWLGDNFSASRRNLNYEKVAPLMQLKALKLKKFTPRVWFSPGLIGPNGAEENIRAWSAFCWAIQERVMGGCWQCGQDAFRRWYTEHPRAGSAPIGGFSIKDYLWPGESARGTECIKHIAQDLEAMVVSGVQ
jgi:hypothetical protein